MELISPVTFGPEKLQSPITDTATGPRKRQRPRQVFLGLGAHSLVDGPLHEGGYRQPVFLNVRPDDRKPSGAGSTIIRLPRQPKDEDSLRDASQSQAAAAAATVTTNGTAFYSTTHV
jgi:hypothetical protein